MIREAFLYLLSAFVVDPVMTDVTERLGELRVPPAVIAQVNACALAAPLALATRAAGDPWWGASTVLGVAIGMTNAQAVLAGATPECGLAVAAARPFLGPGGA